ncbi:MAG: family metallopeptidase [Schumannella sp.]|nr:family metallopeptidase [Schumannella sp.]
MSGRRALERSPERPLQKRAPVKPPRRGTASQAAKPPKGRTRSSVGSKLLSLGAMLFAGALAAGMSLPASAFGPGADVLSAIAQPSVADQGDLQTVEVSNNLAAPTAARDTYTALSWAEMLVLKYGTRDYKYATTWTGPIRWPFPEAVKISSGFGERQAPCAGCSSMHMGLDFQPPNDSPVYAIADGVVAFQEDDAYGYGNHVILQHGDLLGDGTDIETLYAHMQHQSVPVRTGDVIHVGDFLGLVGRTGTATGIHLHFEVHVDGVQVDPFKWLKAHAS